MPWACRLVGQGWQVPVLLVKSSWVLYWWDGTPTEHDLSFARDIEKLASLSLPSRSLQSGEGGRRAYRQAIEGRRALAKGAHRGHVGTVRDTHSAESARASQRGGQAEGHQGLLEVTKVSQGLPVVL